MNKNRLLLLVVLLFSVSCDNCEQEPLVEVLGQPCMIDGSDPYSYHVVDQSDIEEINVGICRVGYTKRDKEEKLYCDGEVRSDAYETCNGLDDDCDGVVDNSWQVDRGSWDSRNECVRDALGVCRVSEQICVNGQYICLMPDNYGKETCDGRDNDCDGEIDEDTDDDPIFDPADRYVYTGDPDTINVGECRAGYRECIDGRVNIRNMRTPVVEICGNGDDDDCDGVTDEDESTNDSADYLLIVDYSGSMSNTIDAVADALCEWSMQGILQDSRFAVIAIGYARNNSSEIEKLTDFTDSSTACHILRVNNQSFYAGGLEFQLDAIYHGSDQSNSLYVDWQNTNRKVIVFSDEEMQQEMFQSIQDGIDMVSQQCYESGYSISAFVSYNVPNQTEWVDLTQNCGGFLDYLSSDPQRMIDALNYWVGTEC
jgi:hypothetical protein